MQLKLDNRPRGNGAPKDSVQQGSVGIQWLVFAILCVVATVLILTGKASATAVSAAFPGDVVVILLCLDIFTGLVVLTGALDRVALGVTRWTDGRPAQVTWGFGVMMFFVSAILNNLAAVLALAPIMLAVLRTINADRRATTLILGMTLSVCNIGGASTPIGDFPAILLMASGVVGFTDYLFTAFPLFLVTAAIVVASTAYLVSWFWDEGDAKARALTRLALETSQEAQRFASINWRLLTPICAIFAAMIVAWAIVDPKSWPFHLTAIVGTIAACLAAGPARTHTMLQRYDLSTTASLAVVLAVAALATATGWLHDLSRLLSANVKDPFALLLVIMGVTMLVAGLAQAGPAAAAMLPIVTELANGPLKAYGAPWVYTAFAAAICAGSSLFLWSATSGLLLRDQASKAGRIWDIADYLPYGIAFATIQILIAFAWLTIAMVPDTGRLALFLAVILFVGAMLGFFAGQIIRSAGRLGPEPTAKLDRIGRVSLFINIASALMTLASLILSVIALRPM
jgi:Na+/H+ antiporter NhaD/arsenite permease-like protein